MKTWGLLRGTLAGVGFLAAAALPAQFVSLSRCRAAFPCAIPFGMQYRPDPLIAAHYGRVPDSAISVRLPLETPLTPALDKRPRPDLGAVDAAVRKSLELHPPPGARTGKPGSGKTEEKPPVPRNR